jgi:hypothetical protein
LPLAGRTIDFYDGSMVTNALPRPLPLASAHPLSVASFGAMTAWSASDNELNSGVSGESKRDSGVSGESESASRDGHVKHVNELDPP